MLPVCKAREELLGNILDVAEAAAQEEQTIV